MLRWHAAMSTSVPCSQEYDKPDESHVDVVAAQTVALNPLRKRCQVTHHSDLLNWKVAEEAQPQPQQLWQQHV